MLVRPVLDGWGCRPDLTWRRIQARPQITAITIASPTIVRTTLPPEPAECDPVETGLRFRGVFSPAPVDVFELPAASAGAGQAPTNRQAPAAAAAVAAARESGFS